MQSISEIKEILGNCSMEELPEQIKQFEEDSRKGVQTALASFQKKLSETICWITEKSFDFSGNSS